MRLGLGMAALGRPAYLTLGHGGDFADDRSPQAMERHAHQVLDAAFAAGIRYFDAARSYGKAEEFLRSWLDERHLPPGSVFVASKWGYRYTGNWQLEAEHHEVKDHSIGALREQLAASRATLGAHPLYQIHSATEESGVLGDAAVLDGLERARDGGLQIGLSVSGPGQTTTVRRALGILRGGKPLFTAVQATWNLLERSCEEALREAHEAGRTVVVKEALANGRLTSRGDAAAGVLGELAKSLGASIDALALAAALAQPFAGIVLLGASTVAQVESNRRALDLKPTSAQLEQLGTLREAPAAYWQRRAGLAWS